MIIYLYKSTILNHCPKTTYSIPKKTTSKSMSASTHFQLSSAAVTLKKILPRVTSIVYDIWRGKPRYGVTVVVTGNAQIWVFFFGTEYKF